MKKLLKWVISALYGLVMIEVIIMISPFAFYWYSLYAPALQGLHRWRATAWLEAFFLPHAVISTSRFLEFLRWDVGTYCFTLGLVAFLFCAVQLYGAKLLHRPVVCSWLYSRIRHPQYLSLAIAAFGLLTIWPRTIILILYLGMLFGYYWLARFEEKNEEAKHPEYAEYRRRTAMFIPGNPGGRLFRFFFGWIPNQRLAMTVSSLVMVGLVVGGGLLLRRYTIEHAAKAILPGEPIMAISIWPMPGQEIRQIVSTAIEDRRVQSALAKENDAVFTAHVLPANYGMTDMFRDPGGNHRMFTRLSPGRLKAVLGFLFACAVPHLRTRVMGSPEDHYTVIFSRVDEPGHPLMTVSRITDADAKMTPIVIADVSGSPPKLESVMIPPHRSFWGDITMPMF
ncbi:MAG TPA: hypothetical protein VMX16_18360 [Terriglobia bacterium]|nr:hypothetical protein [Terriglobia bacterium]